MLRGWDRYNQVMRLLSLGAFLLFLSSCAKQDTAGAPQATVLMRDGSQVTGAVLSSSPTEIKLTGADNVTRTIPMSQVRSIDYGEPVPAAATPPTPATSSAPPAQSAPPSQTASRPKRITAA